MSKFSTNNASTGNHRWDFWKWSQLSALLWTNLINPWTLSNFLLDFIIFYYKFIPKSFDNISVWMTDALCSKLNENHEVSSLCLFNASSPLHHRTTRRNFYFTVWRLYSNESQAAVLMLQFLSFVLLFSTLRPSWCCLNNSWWAHHANKDSADTETGTVVAAVTMRDGNPEF